MKSMQPNGYRAYEFEEQTMGVSLFSLSSQKKSVSGCVDFDCDVPIASKLFWSSLLLGKTRMPQMMAKSCGIYGAYYTNGCPYV